jgi:hypothetical protein
MPKLLLSLLFLILTLTAVQAQTVYKTKTGAKYHLPTCGYLKSSFAISRPAALAEGLTACSVCKPGSGTANPTINAAPVLTIVSENKETTESTGSETVQCTGTTQAGNRCRRITKAANGRCYQH